MECNEVLDGQISHVDWNQNPGKLEKVGRVFKEKT